jgi:hypothetical protein
MRGDRVQHEIVGWDHPPARPGLKRRQHLVLDLLDDGQPPGQELNTGAQ